MARSIVEPRFLPLVEMTTPAGRNDKRFLPLVEMTKKIETANPYHPPTQL